MVGNDFAGSKGPMKLSVLTDIISAAHLTRFVEGPYDQRGGIMIVAPPGHFKSTILEAALADYPDVLRLSDLNVQQLGMLKESLLSGRYNTLAFGEFQKLYERNPATASNLEGHLRALIDEGFGKTSFQDPRMAGLMARTTLIAGITPSCYANHYAHWLATGFARRLLWVTYKLENPEAIERAIHDWRLLDLGKVGSSFPISRRIAYKVAPTTSQWISSLLNEQPSKETGFAMMKKIYCVLEWRFGKKRAYKIIADFAPAISAKGALVHIERKYI